MSAARLLAHQSQPGGHFTKEKIFGYCRLCGRYGQLTFEHSPPLAAFNEYPVIRQSYEDFLARRDPRVQREGRGDWVFCGDCNSNTGGTYGTAFAEWVKNGLELGHHVPGRTTMNYFGEICPLRVLKQIICMFFATCQDELRIAHPELARFVLDKEARGLPPRYRFYAFWMGRGLLRQTGVSVIGSLPTNTRSVVAEVVHPPFGYVMEFSGRLLDRRPTEITDFAAFDLDERIQLHRRLPVLPTLWMAPGDYRDEDDIDRDIITNWLAEWWEPEEAERRAHVLFDRHGHPLAERLSPGHW